MGNRQHLAIMKDNLYLALKFCGLVKSYGDTDLSRQWLR